METSCLQLFLVQLGGDFSPRRKAASTGSPLKKRITGSGIQNLAVSPLDQKIVPLRMTRRIPFSRLLVAVLLGFASGVYIYQPILYQYMLERKALQSNIPTTDAVKKENE